MLLSREYFLCNNFQQLANFLDKTETATKLISNVKHEINSVCEKRRTKTETVFWEVGANPLFTVGKQSYINDYDKFIGLENIFVDIDMRYPNISIEAVMKKNPDIIILVNMGDITEKEIIKWNKYKTIPAVKNKKIFMLDANDIFMPTPKTFLRGLKILQKQLETVN